MYALGHVGIALAVFGPFGFALLVRRRPRAALAGTVGVASLSTLPDVDQHVGFLVHRGLTHTVWFAALVGLAVGAGVLLSGFDAARGASPIHRGVEGFAVGALAVGSHLLGDVITPMGIRPFAPLWHASFTLDLVLAKNPTANRALFAAGCVATFTVWQLGADRSHVGTPFGWLRETVGTLRRSGTLRRGGTRTVDASAPEYDEKRL
ncbi:MAG: metal-dependent hydrolase [Salinigranum sp.]